MDFSWDKETLSEVEDVIQFAQNELEDNGAKDDLELRFSRENWKKCADYGVLGWAVPKKYGGQGKNTLVTARLLEALGYGCKDNGLTYSMNSQMWSTQTAILKFGTEDQIKKYLTPLINGKFGAFGITEEASGSDTFSLEMTAEKTKGGYILNGNKKYITLAPVADIAVVFAKTDPSVGRWGVSVFIVERSNKGFTTSETKAKMGLRTTPIGDMYFKDCFVEESCLLGPEGAGNSIFTNAMNSERGYILASQLGALERQLEESLKYSKSRKQFGKPIGQFQSVSNRIADMKMSLEMARLILYKVAWMDAQGIPATMEASISKLYVSEVLVKSSIDAIRVHGVKGYLSEYEVEKELRDNIGGLIYSGTSDIQRNIIAKLLGL
jgi:alkylation response protein AidB-like acyl-CoA dehydrogenase